MKKEDLDWIDDEDEEMGDAILAAHETFGEARRHIELTNFQIVPAFDSILVKVRIEDPSGMGEHVFLSDPVITKDGITGELASQPQMVLGFEPGEPVTVSHANLTDWFLVADERGIGGFTIEVLKSEIPPEHLADYTAYPPVSWYNHRTGSAIEELRAIPDCRKCGTKDLSPSPYAEGVCGLCQNEGYRTDCSTCGVPLFRYPGAPPQCHTCLSAG